MPEHGCGLRAHEPLGVDALARAGATHRIGDAPRADPSLTLSRALATHPQAQAVSAKDVKALREETSAGMMDCKNALVECDGDMEKAGEWLRAKGLASAAKKAGRSTSEGIIQTYIHTGGKLGVMVEVNCETDFVAKGEIFADLSRSIAMQIAASPNVEYVSEEDVPADAVERETQLEMQSEDLAGKPEEIKQKMVTGRVNKLMKDRVLLAQPFVKDPTITVDEFIKSSYQKIGENVKVCRFTRFYLGETAKDEEEEEEASA